MLKSLLSNPEGGAVFWMAPLFVFFCIVMAATSTPRRVGDGTEYWAMTEQLAAFRRPSVARGDLWRLDREAQRIGRGFEASSLRFPELVAADGRQDFPHFWLYPLANVPAFWLTRAIGVHPNWAFTLTNLVLLALAFVIVSRHVSVIWAVLIMSGPVIWWIDKAHGDVFTVSLLAMGCALWRRAPGWSLVPIAFAAAQNPALMPVWLVIACVACITAIKARRAGSSVTHTVVGTGISVAIVTLPLVYYLTRLHVWSPLVGYTHPGLPSVRVIASLLCDPNVGLFANAPFVFVAAFAGLMFARQRSDSDASRWPPPSPPSPSLPPRSSLREWAIVACVWMILLAGYAQSMNVNHGATPGINRWTLWLMPWLLLIAPAHPRIAVKGARHAIVLLLTALSVSWSIWFFRPGLPEVYRYPTYVASWLWTHAPTWYAPAPEIFAERVSHREAPILPIAWQGCTIVLVMGGEWPVPCLPTAPTPAMCRSPESLCYAMPGRVPSGHASAERTTFVPVGTRSFPAVSAARRWAADAPFMVALRERVAAGMQQDPELREEAADVVVRASEGVSWTHAWRGSHLLLIYLEDVRSGASIRMRVGADYRGVLIDLDQNQKLADIGVTRASEHPTALALPTSVRHGLLWLDADTAR
jgi:hypothetical protein